MLIVWLDVNLSFLSHRISQAWQKRRKTQPKEKKKRTVRQESVRVRAAEPPYEKAKSPSSGIPKVVVILMALLVKSTLN